MRTSQIAKGKFPEAIAWAKEAGGYVEKKFGVGKVDVWLDVFGDVGTIRWSIDFPDLGAIEKAQSTLLTDMDYWKMVEKAMKSELFHDGKTVDSVFRSI